MDLVEVGIDFQKVLVTSPQFPFKLGTLRDNFFDAGVEREPNKLSFTALSNPLVFYGHILEVSPSIRYKLRKVGKAKYNYIKKNNRHYRYIERCIESDVIPFLEESYGVKRI